MERKHSSGLSWPLILVVGVGIWIANRDNDDPSQKAAQTQTSQSPAVQERQLFGDESGAYALAGSRDIWPPLQEQQSSESFSADSLMRPNYYIVLDGSGSMNSRKCAVEDSKINAAKRALTRFVQTLPADAGVGFAAFDGSGLYERVPLAAGSQARIADAMGGVQANGGTPLRSAIMLGYSRLLAQAQHQLGYGEYHLVLITDGYADPASEDPSGVVTRLLNNSPVILHTIGFCIGEQHVLNQPGRVSYFAANTPEQLDEGLGKVLAEAPSFDVSDFPQD